MWRQVCVLLISAVAWPEDPGATSNTSSRTTVQNRTIEIHRYYSELRRGTTEDAVVLLRLGNVSLTVPDSPLPSITPVTLKLEPSTGITISNIRYPKPYKSKLVSEPRRIPADYFPIRFKLCASRSVSLGPQNIRGRLVYQMIDSKGVSTQQRIAIEIPVMVVDHHTPVQRDKNWPFHHTPAVEIVVMVILSPVLLPFALACAIFMDGCG
jgi:hypothetical protein